MRVLVDVSHPAHVHLFRHTIAELQARGHAVSVTSREKDVTVDLLDAFGVDHVSISTKRHHPVALAGEWALREARLLVHARRFDPDVVLCRLNPPAAHAARLVGARSIVFDDSEPTRVASRLTHPFAHEICTPGNYEGDLGAKQVTYEGYHELAYLHPDRFELDPDLLSRNGVPVDQPYYVARFVSWSAHHDVSQAGLSPEAKRAIVSALSAHGTVYVTSEGTPPPGLAAEPIPVPPEAVHHLLAAADGYVGDSQTMATEAAVLGTPAVRSNSFVGGADMSNFVELEATYGLLRSVADEDAALDAVQEVLTEPSATETWARRREALLADKIDVTDFILERVLAADTDESSATTSVTPHANV